jgi:vanillin dehydrogenase
MRRPMGVVTCISPWNFPAHADGARDRVRDRRRQHLVLKPSEETPYTGGLFFAEVFEEAGVPPGVLNVLTCSRDNVARSATS